LWRAAIPSFTGTYVLIAITLGLAAAMPAVTTASRAD
jgi:FlaG/FlaF family flagellin (archaellin)